MENVNCQINVLNDEINDVIYDNAPQLYEYCNKFDGKSFKQIFYITDCGEIS